MTTPWVDDKPLAEIQRSGAMALGMLVGLLSFALYQIAAFVAAGFLFDYPLDDVYIHLAMSEQIAAGGYGVNAGEMASASSSIIYPYLLAPFAGTALHAYIPLLLNAIAVTLSGGLFAQIISAAGLTTGPSAMTGRLLILVSPLLLNVVGASYMGMEHGLHIAATLAVGGGLIRLIEIGRIGPALVLGCVLGPALRFEGLGVSVAALAIVALQGRVLAAVAIGALAAVPVAGFVIYMSSLGLNPLPNSVMVKLGESGQTSTGFWFRRLVTLMVNLFEKVAVGMLALSLVWLIAAAFVSGPKRRAAQLLALMIPAIGLAHLLLGKINVMHRYEIYAVVLMVALSVYVSARHMPPRVSRQMQRLSTIAVFALGFFFIGNFVDRGLWATSSIRAQQGEMARFAHDFWGQPIAVNDLGYVSYRSPSYVLDLYGLGNTEAMEIRTGNPPANWADPLVQAAEVRLIMLYPLWFKGGISPDWVPMGTLSLSGHTGYVAFRKVAFYAARAEDVPKIMAALERFVPTLPQTTRFEYAAGLVAEGDG